MSPTTTAEVPSTFRAALRSHELLGPEGEIRLAQQIQAGRAAWQDLQTLGANPEAPYTEADRPQLEQLFLDGLDARQEFFAKNLRLVAQQANRLIRTKEISDGAVDVDDLIQEGLLGLDRAIEDYNWEKGFRFSTYANWKIKQAIHRYADSDARGPIHLPNNLPVLRGAYSAALAKLELQGAAPTVDNILRESGLTESELDRVMAAIAIKSFAALDAPLGDSKSGEFTVGDLIADPSAEIPLEQALTKKTAEDILSRAPLSKYHKVILCCSFGALGYPLQTSTELARKYNVSPVTMRNDLRHALQAIRKHLYTNS